MIALAAGAGEDPSRMWRRGGIAVVRVQVGPDQWRASLPMPRQEAIERFDELTSQLANAGDGPALIGFEDAATLRCSVRARDVIAVDVVSTEDPGVQS